MNDQSLTITFSVDQTPKEAFDAINDVRGWWSGEIEGANKLGDQFTYRYEDLHCSRQKVTEFIPGQKVVWLVLDGGPNFVKDKTEWKGTEITFELSKKGDKTEVRFTHLGLVPEFECFSEWSNAWGSFIEGSLRNLIISGKHTWVAPGPTQVRVQPNQNEKAMRKG
jgi:hypothetical protein